MRAVRIPLAFAVERSGADSRASTYDDDPPALFLSSPLFFINEGTFPARFASPRAAGCASRARTETRGIPRAEINTPARMNEKQMRAKSVPRSRPLILQGGEIGSRPVHFNVDGFRIRPITRRVAVSRAIRVSQNLHRS